MLIYIIKIKINKNNNLRSRLKKKHNLDEHNLKTKQLNLKGEGLKGSSRSVKKRWIEDKIKRMDKRLE